MAVKLENLSHQELQAFIDEAQSQLKSAHSNLIQDVRKEIDAVLQRRGLTWAEVYPTRAGKKASSKTGSVAPKYRNPADPAKTWSGRGKQPLWFAEAIKKRGVTAESLLVGRATIRVPKKAESKTAKTPRSR